MINEPKVGIVLVNYNGLNFQNDCIKTIKNMSYSNYEIIVVDNASTDKSMEMLKQYYPEVTIIECEENHGVAKGNNIGIRYAIDNGSQYILLLNNDTEIDAELLTEMIKKADENILITPKIYYYNPSNLLWYAGGEINLNKATTTHYGYGEYDNGQYDKETLVKYTPTCCLLVHKSVFNEIGLMDEKYFMYYDDTDFCVRINKSKYSILYCPSAVLWHKVSSSTGGECSPLKTYYMTRNRFYFAKKHNSVYIMSYIYSIYFSIRRSVKFILKRDKKQVNMIKLAISDFIKGNMYKMNN